MHGKLAVSVCKDMNFSETSYSIMDIPLFLTETGQTSREGARLLHFFETV